MSDVIQEAKCGSDIIQESHCGVKPQSHLWRCLHCHRRYVIRTKSRGFSECLKCPTESTKGNRKEAGRSPATPQGGQQVSAEGGRLHGRAWASAGGRQGGSGSKEGLLRTERRKARHANTTLVFRLDLDSDKSTLNGHFRKAGPSW